MKSRIDLWVTYEEYKTFESYLKDAVYIEKEYPALEAQGYSKSFVIEFGEHEIIVHGPIKPHDPGEIT